MEFTQNEKEALFEQNKTKSYSSPHYVFHFGEGSLAEKDILLIVQEQEKCFSEICAVLQVNYPNKIHYYFTESPSEIGSAIWEDGICCNGVALCGEKESKIYAVYNETVKCIGAHEDTHMIAFAINFPASDFVVEGLAMYMDRLWWGIPNEVWTSYYKNMYPELTVRAMLDNDAFAEQGCEITYPIAGAFTKYLVDTYGRGKYVDLYKYSGCNYEDFFVSCFKESFEKIENAFWKQMDRISFDVSALEEMLRAEDC